MPDRIDLRYGLIAGIYYEVAGSKLPRQLDLLDAWFPGLFVVEDSLEDRAAVVTGHPDSKADKPEAYYDDPTFLIHAVHIGRGFYVGSSSDRVAQIAGRLVGTASSNKEKERLAAELMQRHVAGQFVTDMELTPHLKENAAMLIENLGVDGQVLLRERILETIWALAERREAQGEQERLEEAFSMDDETYDGVLYNAMYQLQLGTYLGLVHAYLWLLVGGLLRNSTGRILRLYDTSFIAIRRQRSETGSLLDRLNYLAHTEEYEYTYRGDDLDARFPGIEWYCDMCEAHLNEQTGFNDHMESWTCTACGHVNPLSMSEIYETEEDYAHNVRMVDAERFEDALDRRREEI